MPTTQLLPDLNEWQAMTLQLIVFPIDPAAAVQRDWWEGLTHTPADETRRKKMERIESGKYGDLNLTVAADLQKIAWTIYTEAQVDEVSESLPAIGSYPVIRDRFRDTMAPWLAGDCPQIKRMGFVGALAQPVPDHEAAYRRLDEYLSVVRVDPRSSDFNYRVNRKKPSVLNIPGLIINRLSTWSALRLQAYVQTIVPPGPQQSTLISDARYACMVQFDINTSPDRGEPLPREMLADLFGELVVKATEIAEHGDQP